MLQDERRRRAEVERLLGDAEAAAATRTGDPPDGRNPRERMRWRLDTREGRTLCARRKAVAEPVNGQVRHARHFPAILHA